MKLKFEVARDGLGKVASTIVVDPKSLYSFSVFLVVATFCICFLLNSLYSSRNQIQEMRNLFYEIRE